MYSAYSLLLTLVLLAWAPSVLLMALRSPRYREGWRERLGCYPEGLMSRLHAVRPVWIHAVSVGEVGAASILAHLPTKFPGIPVSLERNTEVFRHHFL